MARENRRATLADIAEEAGVSPTTASYVLNGRAEEMRISSITVDRVRETANRLGYRPNRTARSLRTRSTRTVGFVSDRVASGHFANAMLVGASRAARRRDHLLVIADSQSDRQAETDIIEEMIEWGVDGIIYATLAASQVQVPQILHGQRVVTLNCVAADVPWVAIMPDDQQAGRSAVDAVRLHGDESLVVVGDDSIASVTAGRRRRAGIAQRLADAGRPPAHRVDCDWTVADARRRVSDWLDAGADADAYVCMNDRVAMGVYQALQERHVEIGVDVSVVSFDGSDLAGWLAPALTSIEIPFATMGEMAIDSLLDGRAGPAELRVPMRTVTGDSIRP